MSLQGKYSYAIQTSKEMRMQGGAEERDGKLYIKGTVDTQEQANKIWDAIKTIPTWQKDIVADIRVTGGAHWDVSRHQTLRGGLAAGLSDGAPDFELIGSYVYHF